MEVEHDAFIRVSIKEQQQGVDQLVEDAVRAKAIVMKVEAGSARTGRVAQTDIKGAGAVGQLPGKGAVLTNRPMAEYGITVGCLFVHAAVMYARPDNVRQFQVVYVQRIAHPGLLVE
ncbi:hypothetical protein D3C81_2033090 [compost metagenome]